MALASSSSNLPALQVDLPGLAQIMMSMGAGGLKKLASSGIDIHTVGSMFALGELAPACQSFRNRLHKARQEQRKEQWWIGLVEIGAGTNYVVDEFLKTRAGENVISLLTPIISILDDESSSTLMSSLFDHMKTPLDHVPGTGQLRAIRSTALPIARKLGFAERLAEIHRWLGSDRFRPQVGPADLPLSDAIPASEAAVVVITALKTLMMQSHKETKRLVFCGMRGAAWVLVYASLVLGLGVCVVDKEGVPIPVTQPYSSAVVLIIPSKPDEVKLQTLVTSSDQLIEEPQSSGNTLGMNWLVTCGPEGCNIFSLLCGCDLTDHSVIGSLIFTIVLEYIKALEFRPHLGSFSNMRAFDKATSYRWCDMETREQISHRIRLTLRRFGIKGPFTQLDNAFTEYIEKVPWESLKDGESENIFITDGLFHRLESLVIHQSTNKIPESWLYSKAQRYMPGRAGWTRIIRTLSFIAALLSHSDWAEGHSKLCYETLEKIAFGSGPENANYSKQWFKNIYYVATHTDAELNNYNEKEILDSLYHLRSIDIFKAYFALLMGTPSAPWFGRMNSGHAIGVELNGILLLDSYMSEPSLRPRPRYQIRQGQFSLDQERRVMIMPGEYEENCCMTAITKSPPTNGANGRDMQPNVFGAFSSSRVDIMATLDVDAILLNFYLYAKGPEITLDGLAIDPIRICSGIGRTIVGLPCGHDTFAAEAARELRIVDEYNSLNRAIADMKSVNKFGSWHTFLDEFGQEWLIHPTMPFTISNHASFSLKNYGRLIAPTEGSPACHWAALARKGELMIDRDGTTNMPSIVLQGQRCLHCIVRDAAATCGEYGPIFGFTIVLGDTV